MNLQIVEQVVTLLSENPISEITIEQEGMRIHVRKPAFAPPAAVVEVDEIVEETRQEPAAEESAEAMILLAPMVGVFHSGKPPLRAGMAVAAGQIVGSIESMKLMNDVIAETAGRVAEVLIKDGTPVEYGQPLFRLSRD